ncbi:MAG: ABC transporter ATP-binding protein [Congregibacter sp.]
MSESASLGTREIILSVDQACLVFQRRTGFLSREKQVVLTDLSIDLRRGETLGLIGRNGCGKSTLLRVMAGILRPTLGQVRVDGGVSRAVLALGLGFRGDLSGRDNAFLSAMLQGCSRREATGFLPKIREFAGLGEAFDRPVSNYSTGMRARLGFATAMISHVDILFIDEVLAVGDEEFGEKAAAALKARIGGDQTVVLVSHNLNQIEALCDRAVWIDQGQVAGAGATRDIIKAYRAEYDTRR